MDQALQEKVNKAIQERFVGNFIFTADELSQLFDQASRKLRQVNNEWGATLSRNDYRLIFVVLVNLAKEWGLNEDAFWEFIYRKLLGSNISGEGKTYTQIKNVINGLNRTDNIFRLDCYTKKYYATLCSHSFAPKSSIESFFQMCWEIYCEDLDQHYEKNDPILELITQSLSNRFNSTGANEDDFQIGSKIYSFRAGVRGLAIDKPELMTELLNMTMSAIDSLFNTTPLKLDKYINVLINEWWKTNEQSFGVEKARSHSERIRTVTDYSQIRARYVLDGGTVKLVIPSILLLRNIDYQPVIQITVNGKQVYCKEMRTSGSGIITKTKAFEYSLSDLEFKDRIDICIEISHCDEIIYDSKKALCRDFILFKNNKEVLSQDCLPGIYFLFSPGLDGLLRYPEDIHRVGINTFSLESFDGEVIQSLNKTVFFINEKSNRNLYFFAKEYSDALFRCGDEEYKLIDGELFVNVCSDVDTKQFGVRYENCAFKLDDFDTRTSNDQTQFIVSSLLNVGEPQHISIFRYADNSIVASINLIKFNNIQVEFDKDLYFGRDDSGKVCFTTQKYHKEATFTANDTEVTILLESGEIVLFPPVLRWRIDNNEWNAGEYERPLWYREITNSSLLSIDIPRTMSCSVALMNHNVAEQQGNKLAFKLGETLFALSNNERSSMDYFELFVLAENKQVFSLAKIYYRQAFIDAPLFVLSQNHTVFWLPEAFVGDENAKLRFDILQSGQTVASKEISATKKESFNFQQIAEGFYQYRITLLGRGFLKQEKELANGTLVFGNEKKLKYKNKTLEINKAVLFDSVDPVKIRRVFIDCIVLLGSVGGYDYYSGSLFIKTKDNRKTYLNYMITEGSARIKVNPVRIEFKSDNECYLGYGLDTSDEDYDYWDEFTLDSQGKTTIGKTANGLRTRSIDYFVFEVKDNV